MSNTELNTADLAGIAHHEAGHAVIARVLNLPCGLATIVPDDDSAGHAITGDPWDAVAQWDASGRWRDVDVAYRARIIAFMAGAEAEIECLGSCRGGDGDDRWQIALMLESLLPAGVDPSGCENRLRRFTRALVRRHRGKLEAVAQRLLKQEHASKSELDAMVHNRPPPNAGPVTPGTQTGNIR